MSVSKLPSPPSLIFFPLCWFLGNLVVASHSLAPGHLDFTPAFHPPKFGPVFFSHFSLYSEQLPRCLTLLSVAAEFHLYMVASPSAYMLCVLPAAPFLVATAYLPQLQKQRVALLLPRPFGTQGPCSPLDFLHWTRGLSRSAWPSPTIDRGDPNTNT
jgi:hypothetical protein